MRPLRSLSVLTVLALPLVACDATSGRPTVDEAVTMAVTGHEVDDQAAKKCLIRVAVDNQLKVELLRVSGTWQSGWERTGRFTLTSIPAQGRVTHTLKIPMNRDSGTNDCDVMAENLTLTPNGCESLQGPCARSEE